MAIRNNRTFLFVFCLILSFQEGFAKDLNVDIGLYDSSIRSYISASKAYSIYKINENEEIADTLLKVAADKYTLVRFGTKTNEKLIIASEPNLATSSQTLLFSCKEKEIESDCIWTIKDSKYANKAKQYRGLIIIKPKQKDFTLINRLALEDYLKGVVPSEMPSSWHKEALKAQSVAARTYTISKLNRRKSLGYDLKPTVEDQVYLGVNHEHPATNQAIKETAGLIMTDKQGKPVEAYFYSQAGFATASASDVWGIEHHSYLRPQMLSDNPSFWQKNFSMQALNTALADLKFSSIKAITILNPTPEGRAKDILISGDKAGVLKHIKLTGEELRHKLSLRSTFFNTKIYNSNISFVGKGFGHGIGMSQYGAQQLARTGKSFKQILEFYYAGANFKKL